MLATSGVIAIVLGLALQSTLADVFSGIAVDLERPYKPGDLLWVEGDIEGIVVQVSWRSTQIMTRHNNIAIVPNSVIAKAIVTNHHRLYGPYLCVLKLKVENTISPAVVISMLQAAAAGAPGAAPSYPPVAHACAFIDTTIEYELNFGVEQFTLTDDVLSRVINRIVDMCRDQGIHVGATPIDVRLQRDRSSVRSVP